MQKVSNMTKEELAHYGTLIGEAFAAEGDGIATTAPREDIIKAFEIMTEYFYNSGVLYTTSDNHEGFLAYWRKSTKIKLKPALHMVGRMLREMSFRSVRIVAGSSEELYAKVYKKEKDYVAVSMVVVLREYQGKGYMKKILLIDDSDTYIWNLRKYLQRRGYPVKTASTLNEARAAIQEEMPLVVCCDLDLPDGSGMDFLDEVRAADKELPFILASCHDKDDYEQEAMRRGATLCMDKMKGLLLQDKLVEYAYRQLSGEKAPTFHKLLFVYAEDTSAEVLRAAMLQKGFDLILVSSIEEAKRRIFEDKEIELILCNLELPDGTAMELFHTLRRVAGMFQMKNPPVRLLPFFILTENNDLATEYEYRHEGVNDYITAPVNIPELIRRVLFFVE